MRLTRVIILAVISLSVFLSCRNDKTPDQKSTDTLGQLTSAVAKPLSKPEAVDSLIQPDSAGIIAVVDSSEKAKEVQDEATPEEELTQKPKVSGFIPHPGFVLIRDYVPDVIEDIRYSTTNNFMGCKVNGYKDNCAIISEPAAKALQKAADEFREMGYVIKVYDAYRPQQAVDHFVRWAKTSDQKNKKDYYPTIAKQNLFPRYIASKSGHSKGSTLDMTICDKVSKKELDMGSHFDYFGPPSHTMFLGSYPGGNVTKEHQKNRLLLKRVMEKHGFTNYANEWWHYTLKGEPYPRKYFNFVVRSKD